MLIRSKEKRIEELEELLFQIDMIDRWTQRESDLYTKYSQELRELKEEENDK